MSDPRFEHGEWDALAVGWALSALDPDDQQRFAEHLEDCDRCTATVRESLYTVADLAYAVPDEEPPPALKSRLMAAVAAEPRGPVEPAEWPLGAPHPGTPAYDPSADWFARHAADVPAPDSGPRPSVADGVQPAPADGVPPDTRPRPPVADGFLAESESRPSVGGGFAAEPGSRPSVGGGFAAEPGSRPSVGGGFAAEPGPRPSVGGGWDAAPDLGERHVVPDPRRRASGPDGPRRRGRHSADDVVIPFAPRRSTARRFTVAAAAAAVLALVAGLAAWNVQLRSDRDNLQSVVAQREAAIAQLTANGPARVAALTASGQPSPTRKATLVVRGNQVEIIAETLDARTGNLRYWLWTLKCGDVASARPVRGFTVAQPEFSVRDIGSSPGLATATCFALSEEVGTATPTKPATVVAVGSPA